MPTNVVGCNVKYISDKLVGKPFPKYDYLDVDGNKVDETFIDDNLIVFLVHSNCKACRIQSIGMQSEVLKNGLRIKLIGLSVEEVGKIRDAEFVS